MLQDVRVFGNETKFAELLSGEKFYNVTVKLTTLEDENVKTKSSNDTYLIATDSITEIDVIINEYFKNMTFEYKITSIKEQKLNGIMLNSTLTKRNIENLF